ncbi:MAG: restriction endonuclease [Rhizobacter sp.]|nr:restriction endonuclease [Rhizobacter sp.]
MSEESAISSPDAHLDELVEKVRCITEAWGKRNNLWHDATLKAPLDHYDSEPGSGSPILLLCSDGPAMSALEWDDEHAVELRHELEQVGVFMEMEDRVTACYHLIEHESELQKAFDRRIAWQWTCRLIEGDATEVSGDLYQHFADHPEDFHKLSARDFEKLVSSVFAARGWRTELGPGASDGGVDLRLWQTDPIGDLLTLVQIKRYAPHRPVHLDAVAALEAHVNRESASRGLVVTSSRFLPGVHAFASKQRYRLQLAEQGDLQSWCAQAANEQLSARNRALALGGIAQLMKEMRTASTHPRLLFGGRVSPGFCVVLSETETSALLARIPSVRNGDAFHGWMAPLLDGSTVEDPWDGSRVFRAQRRKQDGRISYWGRRQMFEQWDGRPHPYDHWD